MKTLPPSAARLAGGAAFGRLPLNALRAFDAFARHGSMSAAAEALAVQPSAVSMQLKALQQQLGRTLVRKAGRGAVLTPEGLALAPAVASALAQLERALAGLRGQAPRDGVTVSLLPNFVTAWLLPRLAAFEREHPGLELSVHSSSTSVALGRGGPQCAVRLGPGQWADTRAEKLADEWLLPVCTREQLQRCGPVEPGAWPAAHALIHNRIDPWSLWASPPAPAPRRRVQLDDTAACVAAAEAGLGAALTRLNVARPALQAGRLVAAGPRLTYRYAFWFVTPRGLADTPAVAALRRWFRREMTDDERSF